MTHRPSRRTPSALALAAVVVTAGFPAAALHAQPRRPATAAPVAAGHAQADAGYQAYARGDFAAAVRAAREAVQLAPERRDYWLLLAQAHLALGAHADAEQALQRAQQVPGDEAAVARLRADLGRARAQAAGDAMYRALQANDLPAAIASGQQAVQAAPGNAVYRLLLAHALLRAGQPAEAERAASEAVPLLPQSAAPLALRGAARQGLGRAAEANADLDRALQQGGPSAAAQKQLRLLAADVALAQGDGARAQALLQALPADDAAAQPRRAWARLQAAGGAQAALAPLQAPLLDCGGSDAAQACTVQAAAPAPLPGYANAVEAYRLLAQNQTRPALEQARLASAASPAHRDWQLLHMNAALAAGELEEARRAGDAARAAGGDLPPAAQVDLAYLATRLGDDRAAADGFRQADTAGALPATALLDAGYAAVRARRDHEAVAYFHRAIDADGVALQLDPQMRYDTRRMAAEVSRKWGVLASLTLRNGGGVGPNAGLAGGPAGQRVGQTGAEVYYRPWGFRNGQFVELFARGFMTPHSESGALEGGDSFQGGLGVRWKPLTAHNLVFSMSRVFGPNVNDDWLAQAGYSLDIGTDLRVDAPSWWTTRIAAEVGRYLGNHDDYAVASAMFGRSYLVGSGGRTVLYPHAVLAAEYSSTEDPRTSVGAGPGVSLRHWFREDKYNAPRSYVDVTLQYRARIAGDERMKGLYFNTLVSY